MKKNILDIITYNDDNHAEKIWINGMFVNDSSNIGELISSCVRTCKNKNFDEVNVTSVWLYDIFEELDEDSDEPDNIFYWFETVRFMSKEQLECIKSKDWKKLLEII